VAQVEVLSLGLATDDILGIGINLADTDHIGTIIQASFTCH